MSCPDILWAIEAGRSCKLSTSERMVLITLSDRANGARVCWPSMRCIADDTGLSDRQVRTLVHSLADRELIRMELRGRSMHYFILREQRKPLPETDPDDDGNEEIISPVDAGNEETTSANEDANAEGIAADASDNAEAVSGICCEMAAEQRKPLPSDSGNLRHSTPEAISAKPVQEEPIKKPKTRTREHAREGRIFSDSRLEGSQQAGQPGKRSAMALEAALDASGMAADERANVTVWLKHQKAGDLSDLELAQRLSFIRQRYPFCGYPWLSKNVPAAAEIATVQGWHPVSSRPLSRSHQ